MNDMKRRNVKKPMSPLLRFIHLTFLKASDDGPFGNSGPFLNEFFDSSAMTFIYLLIFLNMILILKKGGSLLWKSISTTDSHVNEIFVH